MDVRIFQYRIARWLEMLVVVLTLAASCAAQAVVESIPRQMLWYLGYQPYPSADAACAATKWTKPDCYATGAIPWSASNDGSIMYMACTGFCPSLGTNVLWAPMGYSDCPSATTYPYPSIPFQYNPKSGMCERDVPEQVAYTLTLSGGTEVEPSKGSDIKTLPIIATVKQSNGQLPANPVKVHVSLKVDPKTGGHDHGDSTRPRGGIAEVKTCPSDDVCWTSPQPTDGNGQVVFNFNAPEASGTHTISATCEGCSNTATKPVDVKVDGLLPILDSVYYALTESDGKGGIKNIGDNGNHSDNHYLTSVASMNLWQVARNFYEYQIQKGIANPTLLHLNDASLKWGGKFDIKGKWVGYHYKHDRGVVIDIRANTINEGTGSTPGSSIPESMFIDFETMAAKNEVNAKLHCSADRDPAIDNCVGDLNRHYHVILN